MLLSQQWGLAITSVCVKTDCQSFSQCAEKVDEARPRPIGKTGFFRKNCTFDSVSAGAEMEAKKSVTTRWREKCFTQEQWFSNCSFHPNHMEGLLKYTSLIQRTWGWGRSFACLTTFLGMPLLLVQEAYFKNFRVTHVFSFNSPPMRLPDIPGDSEEAKKLYALTQFCRCLPLSIYMYLKRSSPALARMRNPKGKALKVWGGTFSVSKASLFLKHPFFLERDPNKKSEFGGWYENQLSLTVLMKEGIKQCIF